MRRKMKALLVGMALAFTITGCGKKGEVEEKVVEEKYTPITVEEATKDSIANSRILNGKVISDKDVIVSPKLPGKVESVRVSLGDKVNAGDVLFTIEKTDLSRNMEQSNISVDLARKGLDQANNAIEMSKIGLETARANRDKALVDYERAKELFDEGGIAKSQLEQLELAYISAESQFKNAESQLVQSEIALSQAGSQLSQAQVSQGQIADNMGDAIVKSPISGVVTSLDAKVGQIIGSGQAGATIVNNSELYVQFEVIEDVVNRISIGESIGINLPSLELKGVNGRIDYISPIADIGNKLYSVKVKLGETYTGLKPGMTAEIELKLDQKDGVIVVNRNAVLNKGEYDYVYIVEDNKAVKKKVKLGLDTGDYVEVIEGISSGDKVIIKGQHYVDDGSLIKIVGGKEDESI